MVVCVTHYTTHAHTFKGAAKISLLLSVPEAYETVTPRATFRFFLSSRDDVSVEILTATQEFLKL